MLGPVNTRFNDLMETCRPTTPKLSRTNRVCMSSPTLIGIVTCVVPEASSTEDTRHDREFFSDPWVKESLYKSRGGPVIAANRIGGNGRDDLV